MNSVNLIGRAETAPVVEGEGEAKQLAFLLGVDRPLENGDATELIPVICEGRQAEVCEEYLHRGDEAAIDGKLVTRDGGLVVLAARVQFFPKPRA